MKLIVASDHFGYPLKQEVLKFIQAQYPDIMVTDFGVHDDAPVDYPDIAFALAKQIADGTYDRGILVCGTGAGMAICANKIPGVRAVCCHDLYTAERAQKSNNAQIMTMGSQVIGAELAKLLVASWLQSTYAGGRSAPKLQKIADMENAYQRRSETGV